MKIFIIDDDELFTKNLSHKLKVPNVRETYVFSSLSEALGKLDLAPEIIILDHFLQGTLGMELIPILKRSLPDSKIIYISGQKNVSVLANALRIGATQYIKKDENFIENITKEVNTNNKKVTEGQSNSKGLLLKLKSLVTKQDKTKLFIVDDDELYSVFLRYKLSQSHIFDIVMYNDGAAIIEDVHKKPELLILDYKLLKMTAEVVLEEFKKKSPKTRVIILSAQEDIDIALNLFELGIDDYVVKDKYWQENLVYSIDKYINNRKKSAVSIA